MKEHVRTWRMVQQRHITRGVGIVWIPGKSWHLYQPERYSQPDRNIRNQKVKEIKNNQKKEE